VTPAQVRSRFGAALACVWLSLASQIGEIGAYDEFSGAGGLSQGATSVPGVVLKHAANHQEICIRSHTANYPGAEHYLGDVHSIDVAKFPYYPLFLAAPQCPPFSGAAGKRRDFDRDTQGVLWETESDAKTTERKRGRLLMHEVPRYLDAMALRGEPVLGGVVENVHQARQWDAWSAWINRIRNAGPGYEVKVIALNSMHARPVWSQWAPQSRNRLYVAYWLRSFGRAPDWDKWLRPRAWCQACGETTDAIQVFKDPRNDMGTYGAYGQYWYRCPHRSCGHAIIEPAAVPAAAVLDWSDPGTPIGARKRPLEPATLRRIEAGIRRHAIPIFAEAGNNTSERTPGARTRPVTAPVTTQPTRTSKALAVPPSTVPLRSSRDRSIDPAASAGANSSGQGLPVPDAALIMRNNTARGDQGQMSTPVGEPLRTLTSKGNQSLIGWSWDHLLVPYYGTGVARTAGDPVGTVTTKDRWSLARIEDLPISLDEVLFRMLKPAEIGAAMAFADDYIVLGTREQQVMQYGNAVTPPAGEVIISALVELISGIELPRELALAA
jgi:DNA (cytosine-5)-methyltransferase 1